MEVIANLIAISEILLSNQIDSQLALSSRTIERGESVSLCHNEAEAPPPMPVAVGLVTFSAAAVLMAASAAFHPSSISLASHRKRLTRSDHAMRA
jgi:hypothetical protein